MRKKVLIRLTIQITTRWVLLFGKTSIVLGLIHLHVQPIHVTAIGALGLGAGMRKACGNEGTEKMEALASARKRWRLIEHHVQRFLVHVLQSMKECAFSATSIWIEEHDYAVLVRIVLILKTANGRPEND